jgi:hypothetical protein
MFSACTPDIQIVRCGGQEINFYRAIASTRMETTAIYNIPHSNIPLPCYKIRGLQKLNEEKRIRPIFTATQFPKVFFTEAKSLVSTP